MPKYDKTTMVDLHVHCEYSIDAEGSVEDYVTAAIDKGIRWICFTTHCDLDPQRRHHDGRVRLHGRIVDVTDRWLDDYVAEISQVSEKYSGAGVTVLCGLEVGYVPGIEDLIEDFISSHTFDFILGGIHTLEGVDIVSPREAPDYFARRSLDDLIRIYFEYLDAAVDTGLFDCIAHIDIYKRCGFAYYGEPIRVAHRGRIEQVLEKMANRDIGLELNSGGLRKGLPTIYPEGEILELARSIGIARITMGSDAHRPGDVGSGLDICRQAALGAGFTTVNVWQERQPHELPIKV